FGCVLFEMLTGRRSFEGEMTSEVLAKVIEREPDWALLPARTPRPLNQLLRRCLKKDHKRRLADIADARFDLEESSVVPMDVNSNTPSRRAVWILVTACLLFAVVAGSAADFIFRTRSATSTIPSQVARLDLNLPPGVELYTGAADAVAVSRD